ncbi:MAG: GNAT family N-acetyltransferase [Bacteroidota bacterium]|nr:GNAT family N-acetyltransferase [Bacteroidota bacterium]
MKRVRSVGKEDLPLIRDLAHKIWPVAYGTILSPEQLDYMLEKIYSLTSLENQLLDLGHRFVVVMEEQVPVGFASYSKKEGHPQIIRLHKIYILPSEQGKGTGKYLLQYVKEAALQMGGTLLQLNVNRYNPALHFYEKNGFEVVGQEDIDIGEGYYMNDYIMEFPVR